MARDRLEGYRGLRPDGLRQAVAHANDPENDPALSKYHRLVLGVSAEKLMAGVASTEEVGAVMGALIQEAERHAKESLRALLGMPDLQSPEAISAHFEARVAAQVLKYLNDMIRSGHSAGRELAAEDPD